MNVEMYNSVLDAHFESIKYALKPYISPCSILQRHYATKSVTLNFIQLHAEIPSCLTINACVVNLYVAPHDSDGATYIENGEIYAPALETRRVVLNSFPVCIKRNNKFVQVSIYNMGYSF